MPVLQVRITDDEMARLKGWAKTQGLSVSALVKQKVFNSEGPLWRPPEYATGAIVDEADIPEPRRTERLRQRSRTRINPPPAGPPPPPPPPPPRQTTYVEFRPAPKPGQSRKS